MTREKVLEVERQSAIRSELRALGVADVEAAYAEIQGTIYRAPTGELRGPLGDPMKEWVAHYVRHTALSELRAVLRVWLQRIRDGHMPGHPMIRCRLCPTRVRKPGDLCVECALIKGALQEMADELAVDQMIAEGCPVLDSEISLTQ